MYGIVTNVSLLYVILTFSPHNDFCVGLSNVLYYSVVGKLKQRLRECQNNGLIKFIIYRQNQTISC